MKKTLMTIAALLMIAGCNQATVKPASAQTPAPRPAMPRDSAAAPAATLSGTVLETFNSAGYTYLRIQTKSGEEWAAVRETKVAKGSIVNVVPQMTAENFEATSLKRKFDRIVFGTIDDGSAMAAPVSMASSQQMPPGHPTPGKNAGSPTESASQHMQAPDMANIRVEKAAGGKTVAELWSQKEAIKNKPVLVRGKVVKFLTGIMGKNWIHLRDGSGSPGKGDDDITITTNDVAKVGDVVVVTGTLKVDKDFGSGYRYPVIVEDAKISK